ncbi:bactofilin family protein [Falsiroseomonas tokyonensis]|uniref:Membrane-associated oxidoreductase n=1 Tax=Falsiroseomonas tokyonensis TaxID=430521 RepID=A0ABV7BWF2_9PROT|nr:hypothetical protein [Falsiroseomonas tokyonensis]MBU8540007.1 hypothetical protein [Falsiroseomonas tokyonensis]
MGFCLADFHPLLPSEQEIIASLRSGDFDRLGNEAAGSLPEVKDAKRAVRADLLRFLLLGGEAGARPHEKGIRVQGAWVTGTLDLEGCRIPRDIGLKKCRFDAAPILRSAILDSVFLDGSILPGLRAERVEARGTISLRGAVIAGEVLVEGGRIGGNLDCNGIVIDATGDHAIQAEDLDASSVLLRGAVITGSIRLSGARLSGDLDAFNLRVTSDDKPAIDAGAVETRGDVVLRAARVEGTLRLVSARIGSDLILQNALLSNPAKVALELNNTVVIGVFLLNGRAKVSGVLDLTGATIGTIHDAIAAWPTAGDLLLNRCQYQAIVEGPVDAGTRIGWLALQDPQRWGEDFWPQPYEQLAKVFRDLGHDEDARRVLIAKERLQRSARRRRAPNRALRFLLGVTDGVLAVTLLYGRQPLLVFAWLFFFWLMGVGAFQHAERIRAIMPNSPVVLRSLEWTLCGLGHSEARFLITTRQEMNGLAAAGQTQLDCFKDQFEASGYPAFNPWMFSLETLFPVLEVGQKAYWRPDSSQRGGAVVMAFFYFQSLIGWALSLLAVAGFSGLVKSR